MSSDSQLNSQRFSRLPSKLPSRQEFRTIINCTKNGRITLIATFGPKSLRLNSRPVYCSRLYGSWCELLYIWRSGITEVHISYINSYKGIEFNTLISLSDNQAPTCKKKNNAAMHPINLNDLSKKMKM